MNKKSNVCFKVLLTLILFFINIACLSNKSLAVIDTYPFKNSSSSEIDPWMFFKRNCTSYAAWKANEAGVYWENNMVGPNGNSGQFGHAYHWNDNAVNIGFSVSSSPSSGSIGVWDEGYNGASAYGHVAWVEQVNSNGSVFISEYNYMGSENFHTRTVSNSTFDSPKNYISLGSSCNNGDVVIENKTVNNGEIYSCSSSSKITVKPESNFKQGSEVKLNIN